jgi:hypothetical protein
LTQPKLLYYGPSTSSRLPAPLVAMVGKEKNGRKKNVIFEELMPDKFSDDNKKGKLALFGFRNNVFDIQKVVRKEDLKLFLFLILKAVMKKEMQKKMIIMKMIIMIVMLLIYSQLYLLMMF